MSKPVVKLGAAALLVYAAWSGAWAAAPDGGTAAATTTAPAAAPPNTWIKLDVSKTGGRRQPLFLYASGLKKFILAGGVQGSGYGTIARHYDTEEFDLAAVKWANAYPAGLEQGRPASGPLDEEYAKAREKHGYNGSKGPFYMDGEQFRIVAGGQWAGLATGSFAWCYVPEDGRIYLSPGKWMYVYDTVKRTWQDLQTPPRGHAHAWGSMCYDPVNREIVHVGGGSGSAEVSTWVYSIARNEWRKLDFGSARFKQLGDEARGLCWQVKTLLGRCANRHALTETPAEAKVNLSSEAVTLGAAAEALAAAIARAELSPGERTAGNMAAQRLAAAVAALKAAAPSLAGAIAPRQIAAVRAIRERCEQVMDALAAEPPGRARSQMVFDPLRRKIVLFGGDGLDRTLSDTWLYDCATRVWEQRFPARVPAPRAGHTLAWLPKAGTIVLAGGYSRVPLAQEIWTYDTAANAWTRLLRAAAGADVPVPSLIQLGAVNEDDLLVCVTTLGSDTLVTWGCRIDPAAAAADDPAEGAVAAGSYTWQTIDPATWEKEAPDPAPARKFLDELPPNQWTAWTFPRYAPGARNRWGTSAYDSDRHQVLLWGGGHATSHENDVAHFSLRGGFWTIGYHPDAPIEPVYASQPTELSFRDRAHVPMHAYKSYTYDPTAGRMFYLNRAYNPLAREWEPQPVAGLEHRGCMNTHLRPTPAGAIAYSDRGLFRYSAASNAWVRLPWSGPKPARGGWCDGPCLVYDSKRDCLWMAYDKEMFKYDFASGAAEKIAIAKPAALDQYIFRGGEAVYLPEADLILAMCPLARPDGQFSSYAWSPGDRKFYWVDLPFVEGGKPVIFKDKPFSYSDALAYDPALKVAVLNNSSAHKVWALRFDRQSAGLREMRDE